MCCTEEDGYLLECLNFGYALEELAVKMQKGTSSVKRSNFAHCVHVIILGVILTVLKVMPQLQKNAGKLMQTFMEVCEIYRKCDPFRTQTLNLGVRSERKEQRNLESILLEF